jgi:hypothetical protein
MRKIIVWTPINTSGHFPKLENDPKWLARRCEIMNQYVIPSMRAQTCNDFEWWIEVREDTVEFVIRRLNIAGLPAVILPRPIVTDHANGKNVAWDRLPEHVRARVSDPEFIEVRLNSDDMYHQGFIGYLQSMDIKPDTQCILPRQGYYWYLKENQLCKTTHMSPPFYALIYNTEAWLKGYRHRMKGGHRAARKLRNQDMPGRQWVWIVHEVNNKIVRKGVNNAYKPPNTFRQASLDRLKGFGQ